MAKRQKLAVFDNPAGKFADWDFAWLRTEAKGQANSAAAVAYQKLALADWVPGAAWERRAWRSDLLLPPAAPDVLGDPRTLFERLDATMPERGRRDLALILTWWTPNTRALHYAWEEVREFVRSRLVLARELPALLVQHAPHAAGQATPPHIHAIISARRLTYDIGSFTSLEGDAAQTVLWDEWTAFRAGARA